MRPISWSRLLSALCVSIVVAYSITQTASSEPGPERAVAFSDDPNKPRRHFRVKDVADLPDQEREALYRDLQQRLHSGYAISGDDTAKSYPRWTRLNTAPYLSATHGRRFVNNYANRLASAYSRHEDAGRLPVGAIVVKDSFVVAKDGTLTPGPLFIMEKMAKGFSYVSGDWRYSMIMPDGSFFGETNGANKGRVEFCISCHLAQEKHDHLFFVPQKIPETLTVPGAFLRRCGKTRLQGVEILPVRCGELAFLNVFLVAFQIFAKRGGNILAFQQLVDPFDVFRGFSARNDIVVEAALRLLGTVILVVVKIDAIRRAALFTLRHKKVVPGQTRIRNEFVQVARRRQGIGIIRLAQFLEQLNYVFSIRAVCHRRFSLTASDCSAQ